MDQSPTRENKAEKSYFQKAWAFLHHSFIDPFMDSHRKMIYLSVFLFCIGCGMGDVYLTLNLAKAGMESIFGFVYLKYIMVFAVMMGLYFIWFKVKIEHFFKVCVAFSILGFIPLITVPAALDGVFFGVMTGTMIAPFWLLFHFGMTAASTDHNAGNEVSLSIIAITVGLAIGSISGGLAQHTGIGYELLFISFTLTSLSTAMFARSLARTRLFDCLVARHSRPRRFKMNRNSFSLGLITCLEGAFSAVYHILWPVYLTLMGIAAAAVGFIQAFSLISKLFLSPISGKLTNGKSGHDLKAGTKITLLGWLPWLVVKLPMFTLFSSVIWAVGTHLMSVGITARWYKRKTVGAVIAREVYLSLGRIVMLPILVPVVFTSPVLFIAICSGMLVIMMVCSYFMTSENNEETAQEKGQATTLQPALAPIRIKN